ncbi:MAG TPA: SRPBCC domain-containing protein [Solirubrobacterales bacterium]|jgi:uncharacterized protein YndB with AHSA1/START domain
MSEESGELVLELERVLPSPPATVFRAFADPPTLAAWWGPEGFTIPALDFPARAGASYRIEMQPPEGDPFNLIGEFREVKEPERLVFTFVWEQPDPDDVEMLAELTFEDFGNQTRATLRQKPFKTEERLSLHRDGWTDSFNKLEALLKRAP